MSEKFGVKVEEIFDTMPERFRPEGAEGVDAAFGYEIKAIKKNMVLVILPELWLLGSWQGYPLSC